MSVMIETAPAVIAAEQSVLTNAKDLVVVNPLEHSKWDGLLGHHSSASFFYSTAWARVLHETYGHKPVYICRFHGGQLTQSLPVMEVSSPFTGRRGVSLPFSDFCSPLTSEREDMQPLYEFATKYGRERNWRHLECRGGAGHTWPASRSSVGFFGHNIALADGETALFKKLDAAVRRGVRKAQQQGVRIEFSNDRSSVVTFYELHCRTRRRQGVPPQSFRFFENIARHVIEAGKGFVCVARSGEQPLAAAVFFHQGSRALFKFGASDRGLQHMRANNLLMWEAIKYCLGQGFANLHLGRTSLANEGLRRFKLGFGAVEDRIEYAKYDLHRNAFISDVDRATGTMNRVFRRLPLPLLRLSGKMLYRHLS